MKRREILRYTALATGSAVCAPLWSSILAGCTSGNQENTGDYQPQFFNADQFELIKNIVDTILPKTESPSASEVDVHKTIDAIVNTVYKPEEKEKYKREFSELEKYLREKDFMGSGAEEKVKILQSLDQMKDMGAIGQAFVHLKQQTIAFYLSNETIAENYLNYLPVPGEYEPCISLSDVGSKAWAIE